MVRLNWSKLYARHLSSVGLIVPPCVTTTQTLDVTVSIPHRNTMLVRVERFITVEWIIRHYTLFLCQNGVLNPAILAHLVRMFACLEWVSWCEIHGDGFTGHI